jgi:3-keto-disaccharide hydrolase
MVSNLGPRRLCLIACVFCVPAFAAGPWRPLFNGRNLDGWAVADAGGRPAFTVENGAIRTQPGRGLLWYTREKIGNATLRVIYRMSAGNGNSGIFVRIPAPPNDENFAINHGIEVQIDDRDNDWHCTGVLYSMTRALARPAKPPGEWNTMDITLQGLRTIVRLNGVQVTDYDGVSPVPPGTFPWEPERGPRPESGYIALQHHDDKAVIYFREISVR